MALEMALTLLIRSTETSAPREMTFDAPRVVIGRAEGSDLRLPDPSVSHRHASIRQRGADYIVMDEGSTNGTFVGQVRLPAGAPRLIAQGDGIRIGRIWLEARFTMTPPTAQAAQATKEIALGLVADALAAQGEPDAPVVSVDLGPDVGKTLTLREFHRPYVVGRVASADLILDDEDASRRHVSITRKGDQLWVSDLASKNGTRLADQALESNLNVQWLAGQPLTVGANSLSYKDPVREALRELEHVPDLPLAVTEAPPAPSSERAAPRSGAVVPSRRPPRAPAAPANAWNVSDVLVALLALLVLGLSGLGLYWMLAAW